MKTIIDAVRQWMQRSHERYALGYLNERQLRDIGLDCFDARIEAAKPFWRA